MNKDTIIIPSENAMPEEHQAFKDWIEKLKTGEYPTQVFMNSSEDTGILLSNAHPAGTVVVLSVEEADYTLPLAYLNQMYEAMTWVEKKLMYAPYRALLIVRSPAENTDNNGVDNMKK